MQKNKSNSVGDFFKPENTNIRILSMPRVRKDCTAIAMGIIIKQGHDARSGKYIVIDHGNGIESVYCHLSKFLHEPGAIVLAGDEIGVSGETGMATGPHLHFAIKENGKYVDPLPLILAINSYNKARW